MEVNLCSVAIGTSTLCSIFCYWAFARNRHLKTAYRTAVFNGSLLIWINWVLSAPNRVPEIGLSGMSWTSDTSGTNMFSVLCVWIIYSGFKGLKRLRTELEPDV